MIAEMFRALTQRSRSFSRFTRSVGVTAAFGICALGNLFAARFDHRWDLTTDQRYTPSAPLRSILQSLKTEVTAVVLLGRGDPLAPSIAQLLASYRDVSAKLKVEWIDPDKDPTRYLARKSELGIREGRTEDGLVTTDSLLVLVSQDRKYYLTPEDITGLDPENSDGGSSFEHAIAVGLSSLFRREKPQICFTFGHREVSLADQSPEGLSQLQHRLDHDALSTRTVDLGAAQEQALVGCRVIVVASPDVPMSTAAVERVTQAAEGGASLLLLGGLIPNAQGKLESVGLEPLAQLGGIQMMRSLVIEQDELHRLPNLFGGTFFATPADHPVNRALWRGSGESPLRVVVALAQRLAIPEGSLAKPLLTSSRKSKTESSLDVAALERAELQANEPSAEHSSYNVAVASEVVLPSGKSCRIIASPVNLVQNRTFDNPALIVTQSFTDSVFSWLAADPGQSIEVIPRTTRPLGLELSSSELSAIVRYVLFVLPMAVLLSALGVYWLRRKDGRIPPSEET